MAVIPAGTRFDAIRVNAQYLNKRSSLTNTNDPTYSIEDLANTIGAATQGPQGPIGLTGATGANGLIGPMGPVGPAGLNWQGAWVSGADYLEDDAVGYNGASWFCIADIPDGTVAPNLDTTHWALLASQGAVGPQGPAGSNGLPGANGNNGIQGPVGLAWQGAWVSGSLYGLTDAVLYNGSAYYCIAATSFSSTTTPNLDPTNWSLLVQKGDQGIQGIQGVQGIQGMQWQGMWVLNGYYSLNDTVFYDGSSYISISATPFNSTIVPSSDPTKWSLVAQKGNDGAGGVLAGESYVFVAGNKTTEVDNGLDLLYKYTYAKTLTPYGNSLSDTNRVTLLVAPGVYDLESAGFVLDTQYIDLVSLTGERDVIIKYLNSDLFRVIQSNIKVVGVDVLDKNFYIGNDIYVEIENCAGGDFSFQSSETNVVVKGKYKNCIATNNSFGSASNSVTIDATFIDCTSGSNSFGFSTNAVQIQYTSIFKNCTAASNSFGYSDNSGFFQGNFENCKALSYSFGCAFSVSLFNSNYRNCTAEDFSFGVYLNSSGSVSSYDNFYDCKGGNYSFVISSFGSATIIFNGIANNCIGNNFSFGSGSSTSQIGPDAILNNCTANYGSFGGSNTMIKGKLIYCRLTDGSFFTVSGAGKTRLCLDGTYTENNQG